MAKYKDIMKKFVKNYLKKLFRVISSETYSEINNDICESRQMMARLINIHHLHHDVFTKYKGCYTGRDVVLVAAGPTVNKFQPITNCVYVGLNRACLLSSVHFDYLFTIDKMGIDKIYREFGEYDCIKFVGDQNLGPKWQIPESEILKMKNVFRYKTDAGLFGSLDSNFAVDIESMPIGNFNTVSLQAMQFILYTNPKRVYLVGVDCTASGHFTQKQDTTIEHIERCKDRGENLNANADASILFWHQLKDFAATYYPGTEIISVNPVGLRGLFTDLDQ